MRKLVTYLLVGFMVSAFIIQLPSLNQARVLNARLFYWLHHGAMDQNNLLDALQNAPPQGFTASNGSRANVRAQWYAGLHAMTMGKIDDARLLLYGYPHVQKRAYERGLMALDSKEVDLAMFWLATANSIGGQYSPISHKELGRICQRQFGQPLGQSAEWKYWCTDLLGLGDDNLIVNGQFELGPLGWAHLIPPAPLGVEILTDPEYGVPLPSLNVIGKSEEYHGGLFQQISFSSASTLTYSLKIKVIPEDEMRIDVLVWQGREKSQTAYRLSQPTDGWESYSTTIHVEPGEEPEPIIFAPVRVYGTGRVWIDDVVVNVVDEPGYAPDLQTEDTPVKLD